MIVEPIPPVIDLEALLSPISEENPSGESTRYSGLYDEISETRRADRNDAQGAWKTELKVADFRKVVELAIPALEKETKDLQIAVWLSEALVKQHNFAGLRDSLKMLSGLQKNFWETMFPEVDDGDQEGRANAITWIDTQAAFALKEIPITQVEGYNYFNFEDSLRFDIPPDFENLGSDDREKYRALQKQAETEKRVTGEMWRKAKANSRRAFYEEISLTIGECWTGYNEINRVIEEKFDRNQAPGLNELKKGLEAVQLVVAKLLEEKRVEEPDAIEEIEEEITQSDDETATEGNKGGALTASGSIQNRRDALKRLADLSEYFYKTEPHSPISYLIRRAVKWGEMPLDQLLMDVIKDDSVIADLRQILGFNTNLSDSSE